MNNTNKSELRQRPKLGNSEPKFHKSAFAVIAAMLLAATGIAFWPSGPDAANGKAAESAQRAIPSRVQADRMASGGESAGGALAGASAKEEAPSNGVAESGRSESESARPSAAVSQAAVGEEPAAEEEYVVVSQSDETESSRGDSRPESGEEGSDGWPRPSKSRFEGEIIDYRVVELPPDRKGAKPGELREWLMVPTEGYAAHIEEECRPGDNGELEVVDTKEYVANQVLLTLDGETSFEDFRNAMARSGAIVKEPLMELEKGGKIVAVMVPEITFDSVENLRGGIADYNPQLNVEQDAMSTIDRTPNDARYSSQWGLEKIQAPAAWNIRTDASSVVVAVIDTGVNYNHQDLSGNMWVSSSGASASNYRYGMKAIGGTVTGDPIDDHGHGSHCAGIIGAVGNNSTGVAGVAWRVKIMACKNLSASGSGSTSDMVLCMNWAREHGANIISLSQGGGGYCSSVQSAFATLRSSGIIAVCAAGNSGTNNDSTPHYPSSYTLDNIVAVANTTSSDVLSSSSCYGATSVDIGAPGTSILSTYYTSSSAYTTMSGTSMATPFVSGALALVKAQNPSYNYLQLIQKLYAGGDALSSLSGKVSTGKRLNVYKALFTQELVSPIPSATRGTYLDRVVVSWPSVSGASYYRVFRSTSSTGTKSSLGGWQTATSFTDSTVTVGTTYYYWVCAATTSSGGNQSAYGSYATGYAQASYGDSWDPGDDTPAGGTVITPPTGLNMQSHGPHSLSATDKYDFFKVSMNSGIKYIFESTGTLDTYGELYSSASTNAEFRVAYNDDGGSNRNFHVEYTPTAAGTYYLRVRAWSVGTAGTYSLSYMRSNVDSWDPGDDTPAGGSLLAPETTEKTHGQHTLSSVDRYDFFRISMEVGKTYTFESTGSYDMYAELFNSTNTNAANRVAYDDDSGTNLNFKLEYMPSVSQTFYLRIRRYSVGQDGSYMLRYSCRENDQYDLAFCNTSGWTDSALLTSSTSTMASETSFLTNQTIYVCYQSKEANGVVVPGPATNCVKIVNNQTGATRYILIHEFLNGYVAGSTGSGQLPIRGLEAGSYTARIALNEDPSGGRRVRERNYANNVRSIAFTVANPQKTLSSIAISGNSSIASKGHADYRCIATYSDTSTADVSPTWSITSGGSYASVNASGRVTAQETSEDRSVVLQATYGGRTVTKAITIVGADDEQPQPKPFPDIVSYPGAPMVLEGVVYIHDVLASVGDQLAAYVGEEVRGVAQIAANGRVTMGVSLSRIGERISFRVWDASEGDSGTIYNCFQSLVGTSEPQGTAAEPIRLDAYLDDPFGETVTEPLVPPTIIEASVSLDGGNASVGDILAVFSGETLVGRAPVSVVSHNDQESATCRIVMFFSGSKSLSFKLWDADKQAIVESSSTLNLAAGDIQGSVANPYEIAFVSESDDNQPCAITLSPGWNLVSFSVLPDNPTPANVFAPVSSSIVYVTDAAGHTWAPGAGANNIGDIRIGAAYWVRASAATNVSWTVEGRGNAETEIPLSTGWNLVGYTLPREALTANALRTAFASGKIRYVSDQNGSVYPGGSLSSMRPGAGYWMLASNTYALRFDRSGLENASSIDNVPEGDAEEHPFGTPQMRMGAPTVVEGMSVSLFGKPAAYGDYLAVFDSATDEIVSVQQITSEDGSITFSIMGVSAGSSFYFKVWNSASGLESPMVYSTKDAAGGVLTVATPDESVVGFVVAITGEKPSFAIDYDLCGKATRTGGGALSQTVEFGGAATDPEFTVASGWRFVDWDRADRTDVRAQMTVKALYERDGGSSGITYLLTFDANGGTGGYSESLAYGSDIEVPVVERVGYTFAGWSPEPVATMPANDVAYTAQWTVNSYRATFNANGGTGGKTQTFAYGSAIKAPAVSRSGYAFAGWSPALDATMPDHDVEYTAMWKVNTYTVNFKANGGTGSMSAQTLTRDANAKLANVGFKRSGYVFLGWGTGVSGSVVYRNGATVKNLAAAGKSINLYAKWAKVNYQVAFYANGGKGKMAAEAMAYGKAKKLSANKFTKSGYVFIGWATSANNAKNFKVAYKNGQSVLNLTTTGSKVPLYAVWAKKTYYVVFNANGGRGKMAVLAMTYGKSKNLPANKFTAPNGKKFAGWATSKANAKKGIVNYKNKKAVSNLTKNGNKVVLYAVWVKK